MANAEPEEHWRPEELAATSSLAQMVRRVPLLQDGSPDTESASGRLAMSCLLSTLDLVSHELGVEHAARDYCSALAEHHWARWMQPGCLYSLQMLTKCNEGHSEVVVNGQTFKMSRKTARLSGWLRRRWGEVFLLLKQLRKRPAEAWDAFHKLSLREALGALDHAWASFEERFFAELRLYEVQAQGGADLVRDFRSAVAAARADGAQGEASCYESNCCRQLVDHISQLNLVFNPGCKGRTFGAEVLIAAEMVIESSQAQAPHQQQAMLDPACLIASCAMEAFDKLCDRILESACEDTSGQPSSAGLVEALSSWESSWELAVTYVVDESRRFALSSLVDCIRGALAVSQDLAALCDDCDPEMFLVLPRIVWFCFLERQSEVAPLLAPLLTRCDAKELRALQREFRPSKAMLAGASAEGEGECTSAAPAVCQDRALVNAAVVGPGGDLTDLGLPEHLEEVIRAFLRTAEGWSLELQRHHAWGWNHLCAVILWCLAPRRHEESERRDQ